MRFISGIVDLTYNTIQGALNYITARLTNYGGANIYRDKSLIVTPYNRISNPAQGSQAVTANSGDYKQNPIILGYYGLTNTNWSWKLNPDETVDFAGNFALKYDAVNGLQAYLLSIPSYTVTLPAGEWIGQLILNRIADLQQQVTWLQTHTHTGVQTGTGNTGKPLTPPPTPSNAQADTTSINNGNYLIGKNAQLPPSSKED